MAFPFLLDKTPSQMFKFIVKSSEEDNLMEVVDAMKKDLGEINVNIKQYESSRESLGQAARREIDRFRAKKGSIPICDKVLEQELKVKKLVVLENLIKSCDSCLKVISESNEKLKIIDRKVDMLSETVEAVSDRLDKVVKLRDEISDLEVRDKECAVVSGSLSEVLLGIDKFKGLDLVKAKFGDIEKLHGSFDKMKELVTRLVNLNDDSLKVSEELKGIEDKLVKLKGLDLLVKRLQDSEGLSSILTKVNGFVSSEVQYSKELKGLHLEIEEVGKKLKEFNFCPFCHSKLGECSHE
jgi:prefoldin subunit 5